MTYIYNIIICPVLELALANAGPPTKADAIDAATASRAPWETSPWDPGGEKVTPMSENMENPLVNIQKAMENHRF